MKRFNQIFSDIFYRMTPENVGEIYKEVMEDNSLFRDKSELSIPQRKIFDAFEYIASVWTNGKPTGIRTDKQIELDKLKNAKTAVRKNVKK